MYIEKLKLTNFQAHKETEVCFTPGVNVIVGPSDRGKSSLIRALQLVFFNRPGGSAYIRHGSKEARVAVTMDDGTVLQRVRTKSKNYYQVDDKEPLKAPGRDVPPEITSVCPMQPINFQGQHDTPFMLAETAGECGRMLNRCVDLTVIDKVLSGLNTKKRNAANQLQFTLDTIKEQIAASAKYDVVPQMKKDAEHLFITLDHLMELQEGDRRMEHIITSVSEAKKTLMRMGDPTAAEEAIAKLVEDSATVASMLAAADEMHRVVSGASQANVTLMDMIEAEHVVKREHDELMGDECPLCGAPTEKGKEDA